MPLPSSLIQRYYDLKKGAGVENVTRLLDSIATLTALNLRADMVAVFYRKEDGENSIPVAYHCREAGDIRDWESLERSASAQDRKESEHRQAFVSFTDSSTTLVGDSFARANKFGFGFQYPYYVAGSLRAVFLIYWNSAPEIVPAEQEEALQLLAEALVSTMSTVDDMMTADNYSVRLSQLVSMFDIPIGQYRFSDLLSEVLRRLQPVLPDSGHCLFSRDRKTSVVSMIEYVAEEPPPNVFIDALAASVGELLTPGRAGAERIRHDWSDKFQKWFEAVIAAEISLEANSSLVLVAWKKKPNTFTNNDLELLSVFSLFARTILNDALLVKSLRKANRLLKANSSRLADVESVAALADMTSGVAHQFNNIIGGVVGRVQLARLKTDDPNVISTLDKIESQVMEGAVTIRRMQEYATRAAYKNLEQVDLCEVIKKGMADPDAVWQKVAVERKVELRLHISLNSAIIRGSEEDLCTALGKLIENAVHYTVEKGLVEVGVTADDRFFNITVADQGPGIPHEIRKKVFYPFFSTKPERGAGMGLATVYSIVVRHGGQISFDCPASGGTVFKLSFLQSDKSLETSDISRRSARTKKLSILIVDDDEQIREILKDMLTMDGHSPVAYEDGLSALQAFEHYQFDLVITDLGMPGMSGLELANSIHRSQPALPIAMITGWGTQLDQREIQLSGIKSVLSKPFHLKDIRDLVEAVT